jgi:hypothetical protein
MVNLSFVRRTLLGAAVAAVALSIGPVLATPAFAGPACQPGACVSGSGAPSPSGQVLTSLGTLLGDTDAASQLEGAGVLPDPVAAVPDTADARQGAGFGQVAAAPVQATAPIHQVVGTVGAPLVNVNVPCPAPWNQGGVGGTNFNACNAAPVFQQEGPVSGVGAAEAGSGFAQVAAAPVQSTAPITQVMGAVGAPLVNINIPCPAPWQQGGVAGSDFNACNAAAVFQQEGSVLSALLG